MDYKLHGGVSKGQTAGATSHKSNSNSQLRFCSVSARHKGNRGVSQERSTASHFKYEGHKNTRTDQYPTFSSRPRTRTR